jgi:hypothetical protein
VIRTPRYTYGCSSSATPLGPIVPTDDPSSITAPLITAIEPRWTSVTEKPSCVRIVTVSPPPGTTPAKATTPETGATTVAPAAPPTSIPRCCPAAYGSLPKEKGRSTGPSTGQDQAWPAGAATSASTTARASRKTRITGPLLRCQNCKRATTIAVVADVVNSDYSEER